MATISQTPPRLALSIPSLADALGIGPTLAKQLVLSGEIPSIKIRSRRLVRIEAADEYLRRLEAEQSVR